MAGAGRSVGNSCGAEFEVVVCIHIEEHGCEFRSRGGFFQRQTAIMVPVEAGKLGATRPISVLLGGLAPCLEWSPFRHGIGHEAWNADTTLDPAVGVQLQIHAMGVVAIILVQLVEDREKLFLGLGDRLCQAPATYFNLGQLIQLWRCGLTSNLHFSGLPERPAGAAGKTCAVRNSALRGCGSPLTPCSAFPRCSSPHCS